MNQFCRLVIACRFGLLFNFNLMITTPTDEIRYIFNLACLNAFWWQGSQYWIWVQRSYWKKCQSSLIFYCKIPILCQSLAFCWSCLTGLTNFVNSVIERHTCTLTLFSWVYVFFLLSWPFFPNFCSVLFHNGDRQHMTFVFLIQTTPYRMLIRSDEIG